MMISRKKPLFGYWINMVTSTFIQIIDIFFIAGQWIIVLPSPINYTVHKEQRLLLLDQQQQWISDAQLTGFPMGNKNPQVMDIVIQPQNNDIKQIRQSRYLKIMP